MYRIVCDAYTIHNMKFCVVFTRTHTQDQTCDPMDMVCFVSLPLSLAISVYSTHFAIARNHSMQYGSTLHTVHALWRKKMSDENLSHVCAVLLLAVYVCSPCVHVTFDCCGSIKF